MAISQMDKSRLFLAAIALIVASTVGCTWSGSLADERYYSPVLTGTLTDQGQPVVGATLVVSLVDTQKDNCYFRMLETTTDEEGSFSLDSLTRSRVSGYDSAIETQWQMCLETGDTLKPLWFDGHVGVLLNGSFTRLECDVDSGCEATDGHGVGE